MKNIYFFAFTALYVAPVFLYGQPFNIYGFCGNSSTGSHFVSYNYSSLQYDTLIDFGGPAGPPVYNNALDQFGGRYMYLGTVDSLPNINVVVIDIPSLSYTHFPLPYSWSQSVNNPEYDPFKNRLLFQVDDYLISFDLSSQILDTLGTIIPAPVNFGGTLGRVFNFTDNHYSYETGTSNYFYWVTVDANAGIVIDSTYLTCGYYSWYSNPVTEIPMSCFFDSELNRYIGLKPYMKSQSNWEWVFAAIDPLSGQYDTISIIQNDGAVLNAQIASFDQTNRNLLVPVYYDTGDSLKIINIDSGNIIEVIPYPEEINQERFYGGHMAFIKQESDHLITVHGISYQWYKEGVLIPGATLQQYYPESNGIFYVKITYKDGTVSTSNGINFVTITVDDIFSDISSEVKVNINPNPVHSQSVFSIEGNTKDTYKLEIRNVKGQVVQLRDIRGNSSFNFNKDKLSSGMYLYSVSKNRTILSSGKFIID